MLPWVSWLLFAFIGSQRSICPLWCPWVFWKGPINKTIIIINNINAKKEHTDSLMANPTRCIKAESVRWRASSVRVSPAHQRI